MKRLVIFSLILLCLPVFSQDSVFFKFPQKADYPYGIQPQNPNHDTLLSAYKKWKEKYVTAEGCRKGRRVLWHDNKSTVSEGIGYGMLMAVYFNDKELLDDLYTYYKSFPNMHGLMHWKIDEKGGIAGQNAATDAEEDVAFALIMAYEQWGEIKEKGQIRYHKEAKSMLYKIMDYEVEGSSDVLKPGDMWGGSKTTNPSYFAPAYYRVFYKFSNDKRWLKVADKSYEVLFNCWNDSTGLVPDWCNAEGGPASGVGWAREQGKAYLYDAARTPWRIALDYLWYGTEDAKKYCTKVSDFVKELTVFRIRDGYYLDGSRIGSNHNSTFIGPFGVGTMATDESYQRLTEQAYYENIKVFTNDYFNDCLRILTLLVQNGNFDIPAKYKEID